MKCVTCKKEGLTFHDGQFIRNGSIMGSIPKHDFKCSDCMKAIDNTSREPGEDDGLPATTEW